MNTYKAKFQTHKQFYVVGIGHVLTGELVEGTIEYGQQIQFTIKGTYVRYTITDVQTIEYMNAGTSETALILELVQGNQEEAYLDQILGQIIEITA